MSDSGLSNLTFLVYSFLTIGFSGDFLALRGIDFLTRLDFYIGLKLSFESESRINKSLSLYLYS
jgi:hypothetical protein